MKRVLSLLLLSIFLTQTPALAAFYQWVDADGVVHFTDNRNKIPKKFRKHAKQLNIADDSSAAKPPAPAQAPPAPARAEQAQAGQPPTPGGHDEKWWREHFKALRSQEKGLQESLVQKQAKLVELRRKRVIYQRPQDRVGYNEMQSSISADEAKMSDVLKQIEALDLEATRAGVPTEWRQ